LGKTPSTGSILDGETVALVGVGVVDDVDAEAIGTFFFLAFFLPAELVNSFEVTGVLVPLFGVVFAAPAV